MELELDTRYLPASEEKGLKNRNGTMISKRINRQRIVNKNGRIRMNYVKVPGRGQLYILNDHFTTLIDAQWRYVFLIFSFAFLVSWLVFGSIWWGIYIHRRNQGIMCIEKVSSWTSAFLFSLETQTTIGYGGRQITPECPEGVICLIIQCIIGLLISSTMLGLVFAKVSRPHKRSSSILFSRKAVIGPRDGKLYLMFRVADIRKRQLVESHISVFLIRRHVTKEGEKIGCYRHSLDVTFDGDEDGEKIFLFAPVVVQHEIKEGSPFYEYSPDELNVADFEILVFLEGVVESTGMTTQARTSYLGDEINWGHLFVDIMGERLTKHFNVDVSRLHETYPVGTPRICPREFYISQVDNQTEQVDSQQQALNESEVSDVRSEVTLTPNGEVGTAVVSKM